MSDSEFVSCDDNTINTSRRSAEARLKCTEEGEDNTHADKDGKDPVVPPPAYVGADIAARNIETGTENALYHPVEAENFPTLMKIGDFGKHEG